LLLIVRTLFDHAITVAVRTGFSFHVCLPADIFASLTRQPNVMHRGSIASFVMWGTWAWCTTGILLRRGMSAFDGGFNRSTQHLLILLEEEVCDGGDCTDMVHAAAEG
jgi:hypothetical protein